MPPTFKSGSFHEDEEIPPGSSGTFYKPTAAKNPQPAAMPLEFTAQKLLQIVANLHFANDGEKYEQQYWPIVKERFQNCERFWQPFVVPLTQRLERPPGDPGRIARRDGVADDIWQVSYLSYSLFLHLTAAFDHLPCPLNSSFGDFYTHLGSACDLAEDFLLNVYLLVAECAGKPVPPLQGLSTEECLAMAGLWYDTEYPKAYENYHRKGKSKPLYLPPRATIIDAYFGGEAQVWNGYLAFAQKLRAYRNRIVHDVAMGNILIGKVYLVPRIERIGSYRRLQDVFAAANEPKHLNRDFIVREEQMVNDFRSIQEHFNMLWEKPLADLGKLLYAEKNAALMAKYNLRLT